MGESGLPKKTVSKVSILKVLVIFLSRYWHLPWHVFLHTVWLLVLVSSEAAAEQLEAEERSLWLTLETRSSAHWRIWSLENQESERSRKRIKSNHQVGKRDQGSL